MAKQQKKLRQRITDYKPQRRRINTPHNRPSIFGSPDIDKRFHALAETIVSRTLLEDRLGKSYYSSTGGTAKRDLYKALGYILTPDFNDYYARYKRQDIAKRIVEAPVSSSWRKKPVITELENKDTKFEQEWESLLKKKRIYHYLSRADRIAGIGRFGILLLGFGDGQELSQPLIKNGGKSLYYMRPYTENAVEIAEWEENPKNERYGMPLLYNITVATRKSQRDEGKAIPVHYSRLIHIAEGLVDDDIFGTPRLEPILNRLADLEMISGGSSEMFWRGGFPGYAFKLDPEANIDAQALSDVEDEIQDYLHELRRYIRLQGIEVKALDVQVADPSNHIAMLIDLIAAAVSIPKRILLGSERGELASSQDERSWADRMDERRKEHIEPVILKPFIDKMIYAGILPEPKDEYTVDWPDMIARGEEEMMKIAGLAMEALQKYTNAGGENYIPFEIFATKYLQFTKDELDQIKDIIGQQFEDLLGQAQEEEEDLGEEGEDFGEEGMGEGATVH